MENVSRQSLSVYLDALREQEPLSREEEHELAVRYVRKGDTDAGRRLALANLRLVVKIANEYGIAFGGRLDLIQEGNLGLLRAVEKYDPERGVRLSTYAAWWIRAYMLRWLLNNWRLVRIGTTQAQRMVFYKLREERERLERLGFEPGYDQLAARFAMNATELAEIDHHLRFAELSLDAPLSHDGEGHGDTHLDLLPARSDARPDAQCEDHEMKQILRSKLDEFRRGLSARERALIRERWLSDSPATLESIGHRFGVSRERVRQLERRLLTRFRRFCEPALMEAAA